VDERAPPTFRQCALEYGLKPIGRHRESRVVRSIAVDQPPGAGKERIDARANLGKPAIGRRSWRDAEQRPALDIVRRPATEQHVDARAQRAQFPDQSLPAWLLIGRTLPVLEARDRRLHRTLDGLKRWRVLSYVGHDRSGTSVEVERVGIPFTEADREAHIFACRGIEHRSGTMIRARCDGDCKNEEQRRGRGSATGVEDPGPAQTGTEGRDPMAVHGDPSTENTLIPAST